MTIVGIGEDGISGLSAASRDALKQASQVFGSPRHLQLAEAEDRGCVWPLPFSIQAVLEQRGRPVVVLASGNPFWNGVGSLLSAALPDDEWQSCSSPSSYSLAAARQGWAMESITCLGLHAAPFERLLPVLSRGARIVCLLRDGSAPAQLARWLAEQGFGRSRLSVMEALGGPQERIRTGYADEFKVSDIGALVLVAIEVDGGRGLPRSAGLANELFSHDGQITRSAVRALTLSALAPRCGEMLWDIGTGSGSVSVEWCLTADRTQAIAMDVRSDRLQNAEKNCAAFGLQHRIRIIAATAPDGLTELPLPDAVFVGGGASEHMLDALWKLLPEGTRLVANAVTLETEILLAQWHERVGGRLIRIDLAEAGPLGAGRGWQCARPIVQWSVCR
ncbi:Precorrin-6Y C(5,15)-methyltransferase (decarboxylating) [Granulosicoccus antarcticus IMCC3135]|uniref:Precorrin-6Y C(5,15)-methyltransferase (Decarboxylating) n=1 Tax=Granulosicoccus antarcticus IMCC3135 TaxID=1192854 RepID=A0A2Z2NQF5_9GAMM|nr:Precorrin-6Y C(5,15)-methyltransferase (decarboxylating) [Granulosicoccus antarcticus IMCC3135]